MAAQKDGRDTAEGKHRRDPTAHRGTEVEVAVVAAVGRDVREHGGRPRVAIALGKSPQAR